MRRIVGEPVVLLEGPDMQGPRRDMVTWLRRVIEPAYLERLETADEVQLIEWARRVLDAGSLSAVFD